MLAVQGSARSTHCALGHADIQATLEASEAVVAVLNGHDHKGGYASRQGKHFITLEGLLESPEDSNAFCTVHVYEDRFDIVGEGTVTSRSCEFAKC